MTIQKENGVMPGLFNSISQPNLATSVSPTPQTPNGITDINLEQSFEKKNNLSFEDESVEKLEGNFIITINDPNTIKFLHEFVMVTIVN